MDRATLERMDRNAIFDHQINLAQKINRRAARKAELMRGYRAVRKPTKKETK